MHSRIYIWMTRIAVEMNRHVCYYIALKKEALHLHEFDQLTMVLDDAALLEQYLPKKSIAAIYLHFSDPWPKAKHHKKKTYISYQVGYVWTIT